MKETTSSPPRKKKRPSHFVAFKADQNLVTALDSMVSSLDTDRSKFIRKAIRQAISKSQR